MSTNPVSAVLALGDQYRNKPSELTDSDIAQILKLHNDARARYGVAPLQWDDSLAKTAKRWADTCYWGHWNHPQTRNALGDDYIEPPTQRLGENLSVWFDPQSTRGAGEYGTRLWLNEEPDYKCGEPVRGGSECEPGKQCGHWTQILWSGTQRVGCALRTCEDGMDDRSWSSPTGGQRNVKYLVCEYSPPGNFTGQRPFPASACSTARSANRSAPPPRPASRPPTPPVVVGPSTVSENDRNTGETSRPTTPPQPVPRQPTTFRRPTRPGDVTGGIIELPQAIREQPSLQTPTQNEPPLVPNGNAQPPNTAITSIDDIFRNQTVPPPEPDFGSVPSSSPLSPQFSSGASPATIIGLALLGGALIGALVALIYFFSTKRDDDCVDCNELCWDGSTPRVIGDDCCVCPMPASAERLPL